MNIKHCQGKLTIFQVLERKAVKMAARADRISSSWTPGICTYWSPNRRRSWSNRLYNLGIFFAGIYRGLDELWYSIQLNKLLQSLSFLEFYKFTKSGWILIKVWKLCWSAIVKLLTIYFNHNIPTRWHDWNCTCSVPNTFAPIRLNFLYQIVLNCQSVQDHNGVFPN